MSKSTVTACVILIGNEILSGRTQDANLHFLATGLTAIGIQLREARVIPDVEATIIETVNLCRERFDYVFTTGGIGPTHDDITADAVAKAFGVPLIRHPQAVAIMEARYESGQLNEARLKMADVPEGAALVANPVSGAPGFRIGNVYVFAGVPKIMQAMFDGIKAELVGGAPMLSRTIVAFMPEGTVADALRAVQERFAEVEMGSYPFYRSQRFGTSLVLRSSDTERLNEAVAALSEALAGLGGEFEEQTTPD
ncbi:MAG: competence/damage-inducible protein A [Rhodospirillaceae bacterium]|nr:competence/damage-inducible protein A [Rhodospirillaceae bacterium]